MAALITGKSDGFEGQKRDLSFVISHLSFVIEEREKATLPNHETFKLELTTQSKQQ